MMQWNVPSIQIINSRMTRLTNLLATVSILGHIPIKFRCFKKSQTDASTELDCHTRHCFAGQLADVRLLRRFVRILMAAATAVWPIYVSKFWRSPVVRILATFCGSRATTCIWTWQRYRCGLFSWVPAVRSISMLFKSIRYSSLLTSCCWSPVRVPSDLLWPLLTGYRWSPAALFSYLFSRSGWAIIFDCT